MQEKKVPPFQTPPSRAFTLVELLVAIAIITLVVAILLPLTHKMRLSSATTLSINHLRTLGTAHIMYRNDHNGSPPPYTYKKEHPYSEGHTGFGFHFLRRYYRPGPRYVWTKNPDRFIYDPIEQCPLGKLTGLVEGKIHFSMAPHLSEHNVNMEAKKPSQIPAIWPAWQVAWSGRSIKLPLRHRKSALHAAFLDGHVEIISSSPEDGRLYYDWWESAALQINPRDSDRGKGRPIGSLKP